MERATLERTHALVDVGRYQDALDVLRAGPVPPDLNWEASCLRAQSVYGLGRPRQALTMAKRARAQAPEQEWPHRLIAVLASAMGRPAEARQAAREAVRSAPWSLEALFVLTAAELGSGDVRAAQSAASQALALDQLSPLGHHAAALVASRLRDWGRAETALRRALQLSPQDEPLQLDLADVLDRSGRAEQAQQLQLQAVRSDQQSEPSRAALARGLGVGAAGGSTGLALFGVLQLGSLLTRATRPLLLAGLLGFLALSWSVLAVHRRRDGRSLPPGFYEGLRPERRRADCSWLGVAGVLLLLFGVGNALRWAYDIDTGLTVVLELGLGAATVSAAIALRRRCPRPERRADDRTALDRLRVVAALLRPVRGRGRAQRARSPVLVGRITLRQRLPYGLATFWLTALVVVLSFAVSVTGGVVTSLLMFLAVPVAHERHAVHLSGAAGLRLVARCGTAEPLAMSLRVVRHALRFVLLPLLVVEFAVFLGRAHRCLHDLLTGSEVVLVRYSLTPAAAEPIHA